MLMNLLTNASSLPEGYVEATIGESALYALLGYLVVFAGISFLILVVWLVGKLMAKIEGGLKQTKQEMVVPTTPVAPTTQSEEVDEETIAVIMAALMAYYEKNNPKCEFTIKRIKKVRRNEYA